MTVQSRSLTCFKTYDIRGKLETELNTEIAYRIARAFADVIKPKTVVLGGDARLSSVSLKRALANGLMDAGVNVLDLGLTGTEEVYFATFHLQLDAGIQVTASHNPIDFNGMKLVGKNAEPIGPTNGLLSIKALAESQNFSNPHLTRGNCRSLNLMSDYISHLLSYIQPHHIKALTILVNAGNGPAAQIIDELESHFKRHSVPLKFIKMNHQIDGHFPNGIPNPLLKENRHDTQKAVKRYQADLGIAWDGDFDRCFFFDEQGEFIDSYYIVGLLAEAFLQKDPHSSIVHDPRLIWHTQQICQSFLGQTIQCRTGHVFIKQKMRQTNAVYGGENSAHHYFRDFSYCDSGMIPWLLLIELLSLKTIPLSAMVAKGQQTFPNSGEINIKVNQPVEAINRVKAHYQEHASNLDTCDGVSFTFINQQQAWRFNLRHSNTESVIRLNIESKGDKSLLEQKTNEIISLINRQNTKS
ncbi:phosphomannomutase CpsG [uncultured Shewanella sp.]|uniref:phosphomannomutase CpsG n=1 Tax=uncultured Shewanella sp. TaxID=173975 RepID=UPI002634BEEC|nr:phosphomannomutase CpsG [uncultured Shewanella sp.]